jgi:hypothetical protein
LALLGLDVGTSALVRCCTSVQAGRFSIWLLVVNFNFIFFVGLQFRADVFQIPQQRQALPVASNFKMTLRTILFSLTIPAYLILPFNASGQVSKKDAEDRSRAIQNNNLKFDTSNVAIIAFDNEWRWLFDTTYKPTTLTQDDLYDIDSLLPICVTAYNNSLPPDSKRFEVDLKKTAYKRQLVAVINRNGEKEVWVNCFCTPMIPNWKTYPLFIDDGGNCFFNFKINLSTKKIHAMEVNGYA